MPVDFGMDPLEFQAAYQRLMEYRRKKKEEEDRKKEEYSSMLNQYGLPGTTDDMGRKIDPNKKTGGVLDELKGGVDFAKDLGKLVVSNTLDTPRQLLELPALLPTLAAGGAKKLGIESAALNKAAQLASALTGGVQDTYSKALGGVPDDIKKWNEEKISEAGQHTIGGDISQNDAIGYMQLLPSALGVAGAQMLGPAEILAPGKALQGLKSAGGAFKSVLGNPTNVDLFGKKAATAAAEAQAKAAAQMAKDAQEASQALMKQAAEEAKAKVSRDLANGIFDRAGIPREMTPQQAMAEVEAAAEAARRRKIDELFGIEQSVLQQKQIEEVAKLQDPAALAAAVDDLKADMQNPLPTLDDLFQMKDDLSSNPENGLIESLGKDDWKNFWDSPSQAGQEIFEKTRYSDRQGVTIDLSGETPVIDQITPYPEQGPEWTKRPRVITSLDDPFIKSRKTGSYEARRNVRDIGGHEIPGETLVSPDLSGGYGLHSLNAPNSKVATEMVISGQEAAHDLVREVVVGRSDIHTNNASELLAEHLLGVTDKSPTQIGAALTAADANAQAARTNVDTFMAELDAMLDEKVGLMTEDVGKAAEKIKKTKEAANAKLKEQGIEPVEDLAKTAKEPEQVYDPEAVYSMHQRYTDIVEAAVFKAKKKVMATYGDWVSKGEIDPSFSPDDILRKVEKEIRDQADSDMKVLVSESQKLSHGKIAEKLKTMGNKMVGKHDLKPYKFAARCK